MAFREVRVFEVREVLRLWLQGEGQRAIGRLAGMDRKTVRRYIEAAEELGLVRGGGDDMLAALHPIRQRNGAPFHDVCALRWPSVFWAVTEVPFVRHYLLVRKRAGVRWG